MPGTTLRARPRAFGLQPGGSDDFPERTEPAVFGCDEPGSDRLKAPLSRKLPGPERKAEICAGRSQALLRLVAASLPLPHHRLRQRTEIGLPGFVLLRQTLEAALHEKGCTLAKLQFVFFLRHGQYLLPVQQQLLGPLQ